MNLKKNDFRSVYHKAIASKTVVTLFFCFLLFSSYGVFVIASNVIRSSGTSSLEGTWDFENITSDDIITKGPWVDVRAFGAMGDSSDQTAEISNAINSLSGSGTVFLPEGIYVISSTITVPSGISIEGINTHYSGVQGTRITCTVGNASCFLVGNGSALSHSVGFKNLRITASGAGVNGTGIKLHYVRWCMLDNLNINGFTNGTGLEISGQVSGNDDLPSAQNQVSNVYSANNLVHILLTGADEDTTSSCDETIFTNIRIQPAGLVNTTGIIMNKGLNNAFIGVIMSDTNTTNGTIGLDIRNGGAIDSVYTAKNNVFQNIAFEKLSTGIKIDTTPLDNIFIGVRIHSASTYQTIVDASGGANTFIGVSGGENLPDKTQFPNSYNPLNLIVNGEMERWEAGTMNIAPSGWILAAYAGSNVSRESFIFHKGNYAMALNSTTNALVYQDLPNYKFLNGRYITVSAWVYANYTLSSSGVVRLAATTSNETNTSRAYSKPHSGEAGWELLSVKNKMFSNATVARTELQITGVDTTAYFDQVSLVEGISTPLPGDTPLLDSKRLHNSITWDPEELIDGNGTTKNITVNGAEFGDFVMVAAPYDLEDCIATGYVQSADNVEIRLQNENGGTVDFGEGIWKVMILKY